MSKTAEVLQGAEESPSQFYEHLCDALHLYTPFHPEATESQRMINAAFMGQSQGNICRKLQDFTGMNASQLTEG
jgi:hypothetical protein